MDGEELVLTGMVADLKGARLVRKQMRGKSQQAERIGQRLAEEVLESGGAEILAEFYDE
jgi:porphobilinogen deaminase